MDDYNICWKSRVSDAETSKKIEYYKKLLAEKQVKQVVGETRVFLDGNCKCAETNLADLIADSFVRFVSVLIIFFYKHKPLGMLILFSLLLIGSC